MCRLATVILVCALASSAWAGPISDSVTAQAQTLAQQPPPYRWSTMEIVSGTALLASGFMLAMYGFGNPTGPAPDFSERWVYPHRNTLGVAGIGIAAAGGLLAWHGLRPATRTPSITLGPHRVHVEHRVVF